MESGDSDEYQASPPPKRRRTGRATEYGFMRDAASGQESTHFLGSASGIYFIRNVSAVLARNSASLGQALSPEAELVPGEDDRLPNQEDNHHKTERLWQENEILQDSNQAKSNQADNASVATFEDLVKWSQSYFKRWHMVFPYIHGPSMLHTFDRISNEGLGFLSSTEAIILRSIMSISTIDRRQKPKGHTRNSRGIPECLVFPTIQDALSALEIALCKPTSIPIIQAAVSVQVFLISMLRYNSASRIGGLIVRMAYQLGLHRCPTRYSRFSPSEKQLRRRLFWSIYCIERHICQSLGLPLDIRDDDIDVCFPGHEEHVDIANDPDDEENQDGRLRLLTVLAKQAKLKGMILELRNKSLQHRKENDEMATLIHAELAKWWNEVQDILDMDPWDNKQLGSGGDTDAPLLHQSHKLLLLVLKQELIISLNRPLLASEKTSNSYAAALQTCIGASQKIIHTLKKFLVKSSNSNADGSVKGHAVLVWPSLTSAVWMSCFVLIYAAFEGHFPIKSALRSIEASLGILANISQRGNFWSAACAATLKDLKNGLPQLPSRVRPEPVNGTSRSRTERHSQNERDKSMSIQTRNERERASRRSDRERDTQATSRKGRSRRNHGSNDATNSALSRKPPDSETRSHNKPRSHQRPASLNPASEQQPAMHTTQASHMQTNTEEVSNTTPSTIPASHSDVSPDQRFNTSWIENVGGWPIMGSDFTNPNAFSNMQLPSNPLLDDPFALIDFPNIFSENFGGNTNF